MLALLPFPDCSSLPSSIHPDRVQGSCGSSGRLVTPQVPVQHSCQSKQENCLRANGSILTRVFQDLASCVGAWSLNNDSTEVMASTAASRGRALFHCFPCFCGSRHARSALVTVPLTFVSFYQSFGPNNRWKWSSSSANYELPHWGLYQFYGGGGFNVDVFGSTDTFKAQASCSTIKCSHRVSLDSSRICS